MSKLLTGDFIFFNILMGMQSKKPGEK